MKLSISLSEADVTILDEYMRDTGLPSRSAVLQRAIRLLRYTALEHDYAAAWQEWESSADRLEWERIISDGLE